MRLTEIFDNLKPQNLDGPLRRWFKASSGTLEGKIASLHYAREMDWQCWKDTGFGTRFSGEFAAFLKAREPYRDPVAMAATFCASEQKYRFFGMNSRSDGTIVSVIRLQHIIRALGRNGARYLNHLDSEEKKCREIKRLLDNQEISIANEGVSWLTILEQGLDQIKYAKTACDQLGKSYRPNHYYLVLETKQHNNLCRPTICEGGPALQFRPHCDHSGWGLTLSSQSLQDGLPEAVKEDTRETVKLKGYLLPSPDGITKKQAAVENYFQQEKQKFKQKNTLAFDDLVKAWAPHGDNQINNQINKEDRREEKTNGHD